MLKIESVCLGGAHLESSMSADAEYSCSIISYAIDVEDKIWYSSMLDSISVQSGDRVSQMTKTYNDIDAVTRLLEEKEKDLELAARIGQKLLQKCQTLEQRNDVLEEETLNNRDQITQLKYELGTKTDLLRIYQNNELDGAEAETGEDIPFVHLQKKIKLLEEENFVLAEKTKDISLATESLEGQELQLINEFKERLGELSLDSKKLSDELYGKIDECNKQQEDLTHLLAQVAELQSRNKQLKLENEELTNHLQAVKECQNDLTTELVDFKEKYEEIVELLHDAQQQLRNVRHKSLPTVGRSGMYSPYVNFDSLASELESCTSGESGNFNPNTRQLHNLKVFETVRYAKQKNTALTEDNLALLPHLYSGPTVHQSAFARGSICSVAPIKGSSRSDRNALHRMGKLGRGHMTPLDSAVASDSEGSGNEDTSYMSFNNLGRPGVPGSDDLESALQRLSLRRQSETEYLHNRMNVFNDDSIHTPGQCRTPDSIMSTGSGFSAFSGLTSASGYAIRHYHIPEKLQIVKPMEGSATLHQWQQLATPHLGGIFEERPGVQIKGERKLEEIDESFAFPDIEEDEESSHPGKHFDSSGSIYTYTDSKVLHPDDSTLLTPSGVQRSAISSSWMSSPQGRERTTSTFSTTMSLAKVLQERNIKPEKTANSEDQNKGEIVPNVLVNNDPFPATPCNSPTISPPGSPFFSPLKVPGLATLTTYLSRGAELLGVGSTDHLKYATKSSIRKDRAREPGMSSSVSCGSGLDNMNIMKKLNQCGLDNVVQSQKSVQSSYVPLSGYSHVKLTSPMTQLTSLRGMNIAKSSSRADLVNVPITATTSSNINEKQPLISPNIQQRNASDVYHELGNIASITSFRKGGFS